MDFVANRAADRFADHTSREGFPYGNDGNEHNVEIAIAPGLSTAPAAAAEVAYAHALPATHALRSSSDSASAGASAKAGNAQSRGKKTYWATLASSGGSENGKDSGIDFSSGFGDSPAKKRKVAASLGNPNQGGLLGGAFGDGVNTLLESEIVLAAATALITATLLLILRPPIVKSRGEAERRISILRIAGISLLTAICALVYLVSMGHTAIQTKK
jgi:hypothetical protein